MPDRRLRILLVEDNPSDARLVQHELKQSGVEADISRVETEAQFVEALAASPDVVLCDWTLPQFGALRALEVMRERAAETPFLIVSGSIGEEAAVSAIKIGATDYLLKDRLGRLGQAVRAAIAQRELREAERRAREELEAREAQYRALADSIPHIVWTASPTGAIEYINRRGREYSGLDLAAVADWAWERVVHPDDVDRVVALWRAVIVDGRQREVEFRIRRFDGAYRWHIARHAAIRDAKGELIRWAGTCTEIHDQKSSSEILARDAQILASVRDAVIVTDLNGRVTYWNEGATRIFGFAAMEVIGRQCTDLLPVPIQTEFARELSERAVGSEWYGEYEGRRKDGSHVWLHGRFGPITDAAGRPTGILGLAYDVTDRKRAEESLSAVMRSVADAIVTIDEAGLVQSANPAAEKLFGYAAAEIVGQNVRSLMPEPDCSRHDDYIARYIRTGEPKIIGIGREVEALRKDGTTFPADLSVTEFRVEGKRYFTGVVRDLTARKQLEEQFRQAQKMEAVGRLAGGVAHDFNNLLTVINGYSELLLPSVPADHADREALSAIRGAGERAASLTSQLLAFSRKAIVAPRVLDLNDVITASEKLLRRLIGEDIILASILPPTPCRIEADPSQVDQIIMNLAVNARDAMPTGGRLTLEAKRVQIDETNRSGFGDAPAGMFVELVVQDSGCGMTPEVKSKLFEPFFTTKPPGKGTGLGLAVVHGAVKQAGGFIAVDSTVGVGTRFRMLFPEAAAPESPSAPVQSHDGRRGTETVLLVEDEAAVRRLCKMALEAQGYSVLAAAGGRAALKVVESHAGPIHLLVTDVVMPELSGRELAEAVRAKLGDVRVLFVSGYTDDAVIRHGLRASLDTFLQKPFTPLGLARKVRSVLDAPAVASP